MECVLDSNSSMNRIFFITKLMLTNSILTLERPIFFIKSTAEGKNDKITYTRLRAFTLQLTLLLKTKKINRWTWQRLKENHNTMLYNTNWSTWQSDTFSRFHLESSYSLSAINCNLNYLSMIHAYTATCIRLGPTQFEVGILTEDPLQPGFILPVKITKTVKLLKSV